MDFRSRSYKTAASPEEVFSHSWVTVLGKGHTPSELLSLELSCSVLSLRKDGFSPLEMHGKAVTTFSWLVFGKLAS